MTHLLITIIKSSIGLLFLQIELFEIEMFHYAPLTFDEKTLRYVVLYVYW